MSVQFFITIARTLFVFFTLSPSCLRSFRFAESKVPQDEVDALRQITSTMGATYWKFNSDSCQVEMVGITLEPAGNSEYSISCDCNYQNNSVCHITSLVLKGYSLPGVLPPELVRLPHLQHIDFAYNYLSGTVPREWASLQLNFISVLGNRLSGEIPKELGDISSLTYLCLETNQFSGIIPAELGTLINLKTLILSSNKLSGNLPLSFSALKNLTDFRINDNNFSGTIPGFLQNWKQLTRLEMHASGLEGPIPSTISSLDKMTQLRISDINGPTQRFPLLSNMRGIQKLVLRNCNISGEIPSYVWKMKNLQMLDVSFNNLVGEIPTTISTESLKYVFLSGNMLSGNVPDSTLMAGSSVDLSYNNFTWQGPDQPACRQNMNLYLNMFRSSRGDNLRAVLPCLENFNCPQSSHCSHINCGGNDVTIEENNKNIVYEGDGEVEGGTSKYFNSSRSYWGFSSTGDFMDDNDFQNTRYTYSLLSSNLSQLYTTARLSPISLTYFHYCLENGNYTVNLHFAEIQFTNNKTFSSLGRRIFDIYVQERLVWKDFNIEDEAKGVQKPILKKLSNVSVTSNTLEIRFLWAGKGTTRIPKSGVYGPLISAISVASNLKPCSNDGKEVTAYVIIGVGGFCLIFLLLGILWWKGYLRGNKKKEKDFKELNLQTGSFTLRQIKAATNDFDSANKIGEGGFGPVFKGLISDGTIVAVKQLSSKSRQGNREFLNEIALISCLQHPNLVKLHGCCIEGDQLLLVYEYMENNSLARALFGTGSSELKLDWPTRLRICIGIGKGLAFLHEESRFKIVHRDIKATNVLLDRDLNPKISDFGLAKLDEEKNTHISTRVAGTIGYMAPEYALWGYLTYKADVYSFGVVTLEIVSGKNNSNYMPMNDCVCLLDLACHLQQHGRLMELVDEKLGSELNKEEAEKMIKVALLCTNASPSLRPTMSEVVRMLEGDIVVPNIIPEASTYTEDLRFKAMRDVYRERQNQSSSRSQIQITTTGRSDFGSSTSGQISTSY